ncbi:unnamed protein product [Cyprideis torosa]|uniref:Uncharacterized protein n=1 Tax=Cyprideis torosa TaxID=163714 RepID=A0A7R8WB58_9CRUS|nr:unnamed protein product [Cyprideis torosa]CAG0891957.1 unnamed protein product [Cyprideis torosa]
MFHFKKKSDKSSSSGEEKKKKEKKKSSAATGGGKDGRTNSLNSEELQRLEEARRSLLGKKKHKAGVPSGIIADYRAFQAPPLPAGDEAGPGDHDYYNIANPFPHATRRPPPAVPLKPPKKGILRGRGGPGPVSADLDDEGGLVQNTLRNEAYVNLVPSSSPPERGKPPPTPPKPASLANGHYRPISPPHVQAGGSAAVVGNFLSEFNVGEFMGGAISPPRALSPASREGGGGVTLDLDLPLPSLSPRPHQPRQRTVTIQRESEKDDFGFALRRSVNPEGTTVIFAEPGGRPLSILPSPEDPEGAAEGRSPGLLPGDQLKEVNGINVDGKNRDEVIELIRASGTQVVLKVQPIRELSELTSRSGRDGGTCDISDLVTSAGTLRRSRIKLDHMPSMTSLIAEAVAWGILSGSSL